MTRLPHHRSPNEARSNLSLTPDIDQGLVVWREVIEERTVILESPTNSFDQTPCGTRCNSPGLAVCRSGRHR